MKPNLLALTSLLSILLMSIHIAEDIVLGFAPGGLLNLAGIGVLALYLCATLLASQRRWGLIVVLLGSMKAKRSLFERSRTECLFLRDRAPRAFARICVRALAVARSPSLVPAPARSSVVRAIARPSHPFATSRA